jgi:hypothetical protein
MPSEESAALLMMAAAAILQCEMKKAEKEAFVLTMCTLAMGCLADDSSSDEDSSHDDSDDDYMDVLAQPCDSHGVSNQVTRTTRGLGADLAGEGGYPHT